MAHLTKIIAGILVLLAVSLAGYAWMLGRAAPAPQPAGAAAAAKEQASKLFPVVVTTQAVAAGQSLPPNALRVAQLPIKPAGAFTETAALAGRVPVSDLGEGSPLLESQLVTGLALRLADGERAVGIKADEIMGVGNRVQPGDFVDVFVMLKADNREIERSQSRLLLARKRVLAFGLASVDGGPSKAAEAKNSSAGARVEPARTAVLAIPVAEVNRLALGEASGRLLLALRHPGDMSEPDPKLFAQLPASRQSAPGAKGAAAGAMDIAQSGLTVGELAGMGGRANASSVPAVQRTAAAGPRPARSSASAMPAAGGLDVEVIRGDRRETLRY